MDRHQLALMSRRRQQFTEAGGASSGRRHHRHHGRPGQYRAAISPKRMGLAISLLLSILCHETINNLIHHASIVVAEAWVQPFHHHRRSRITRWYVPNDATSTVDADDGRRNSLVNEEEEQQNQPSTISMQQFEPPNESELLDLKILLIDNHDSYTYNLYQYLSTMTIHPVRVIMNDAFSSWDDFVVASSSSSSPDFASSSFDCIVLSPGPGQPSRPSDMGIVLETIRRNADVPILGVCLGHQALGYVYGKEVKLSPCGPVHGLTSPVYFDEGDSGDDDAEDDDVDGDDEDGRSEPTCRLFRDMPRDFEVVRYHSLVVDFPPDDEAVDGGDDSEIEPIAWCDGLTATTDELRESSDDDDDTNNIVCMALRHRRHPHYGVQFHPESIGTGEAGYRLLWNFCEFARRYTTHRHGVGGGKIQTKLEFEHASSSSPVVEQQREDGEANNGVEVEAVAQNGIGIAASTSESSVDAAIRDDDDDVAATLPKYRVFIHKVDGGDFDDDAHASLPSPEQAFDEFYSLRANSFWLDSSTGEARRDRFDDNMEVSDDDVDMNNDDNDDIEGCPITSNSRFSIMGSNDGPLGRKIEYFGREHDIERRGLRVVSKKSSGAEEEGEEEEVVVLAEEEEADILSYLRSEMIEGREMVDKTDIVTFDKRRNTRGENGLDLKYSLRTIDEFGEQAEEGQEQLPFDYRGGYVGYLGYEVRHDTQCWIFEQEGGFGCDGIGSTPGSALTNGQDEAASSSGTTNPNVPTAAFLFADRSLLYDHHTGDWYVIGIAENDRRSLGAGAETGHSAGTGGSVDDTLSWMHSVKSRLAAMAENATKKKYSTSLQEDNFESDKVGFIPNRSKTQYQMDISRSHEEIRNGESYELCVTNQLEAELELPREPAKDVHESPLELYRLLRKNNPAPFSAFINLHDESQREISAALSICCSSPERFLSIKKAKLPFKASGAASPPRRQFTVESKPIKGTAARYTGSFNNGVQEDPDDLVRRTDARIAAELRESVKDRAENLMIVDLLRNDLGRVCQVGSVHVPKLMHIETYATVHQMVSTVRGALDGEATNMIDVIKACFPGGSMTGAPKQRSMEILDEIEMGVSRGPYSGSLGYMSLNGCMDMNIVIRSAILTPSTNNFAEADATETWKASIGCGGAITALSNSDDEYKEMLLKSRIIRETISDWVSGATSKRTKQSADNVETVR